MNKKISILFISIAMSVFSQEKIDIAFSNAPILTVLKKAEENFNVKFSFDAYITEKVFFSLTKKKCSLREFIIAIENKTLLKFNKITNKYYFITLLEKKENYNLLNEVLIDSYVTSGINKNKNGSIAILPQELGVLPGLTEPDVLESLKIIPGVQSPDETAAGIYIRGGTPDQNLIFWDGIKMYYSGHFFGMLSAFNPYTAKKITLSKSGTQARYGNKIAGVIDIKTIDSIPQKITGGFGTNMTHADAYIRIPLSKKTAFTTSLRRSFNDVFNTFTFDKLSNRVFQTINANQERNILTKNVSFNRNNHFFFSDYSAKFIYKPTPTQSLSFSYLHTINELSYNFEIPIYKDSYINDLDIRSNGLSIVWNNELTYKLTQNFKVYFSNFNLNYYGNYNYLDNYLIKKSSKKNSVNDFGFSYNIKYKVNNRTSFLFGYDFLSNETEYLLEDETESKDNGTNNSIQQDKGTNNTHSFFSEYIYDTKSWKINAGVRFNYFNKINESVLEPRLYLEKKINNSLNFKVSLEQKHQTLGQIIEFQSSSLGFDLENQIWAQVNNNNIPLQKSFQVSSGLIFNKNKWKIDFDTYIKNVSGMTSQTRGYNDQTKDFSNGEGKIFGIDILINKKFRNYRTWVNYSYTKNQFKFLDLENTFFPSNHDITNYFSWSHAFKYKNYEFSLGWMHRTGNPYTEALELKTNTNNENLVIVLDTNNMNSKRLPKYHRLDTSITYSFNFSENWKGKFGISILNIYNQKNIINRTYTAMPTLNSDNTISYELAKADKLSLGITPNFVFRVYF
ncbi:TonB-dependent receptor plug domain-containing protein [Tenacibaculum soleae]|uniref:TonB-dependent receptor plug domain-containing protein n=1 Tax=Tenacibaculum soleae TaxID=447689 RepID=UPI0026E381C3|nr:TonB-dependent receptor plug domain-containing protein [Tenacibaculum soleae]MDO6745010.1 TonB-dependent receptor plug domain-containing protein [Tenacibaculum soleae]